MASRTNKGSFFDAQKFTQSLQGLMEALPSVARQREIIEQLETIIQFLQSLKVRIESIPTSQDASDIQPAIDRLSELFREAKANPIIGAAVGVKSSAPRQKSTNISLQEVDLARAALTRFDAMAIDEIRNALGHMSLRELHALAKELGMRPNTRVSQDALVQQLATKVTNTRGYRSLRGSDDSASSD